METTVQLVALAIVVLGITGLSDRIGLPTPLVLIAAGIGASFLPMMGAFRLDQEIVLFGVLPPLLYSAALNTSLVDFKANRRPILLLSVGLVIFTTLGVGWLIHTMIPGIGWAPALAIGAVVAPPDAVATTAIGRRIGLPRRLVSILEGESLLNDATALVALRMAILAMLTSVDMMDIGIDFVKAAGGGLVIGFLTFMIVGKLRRNINEPQIDNALSFITPFAAYVAAERIHGSGVIAVVIAGILLAHRAPLHQTASSRVAERHNWRTISFVLEHAVFFIIGLQASWLIGEVDGSELTIGRIATICAASLVTIIALRLVWVFPARYLLVRPGKDQATGRVPPWTYTFVLGWAGMRGVVTLAAAYLLPLDTQYREVLLMVAFTAVAGTLFIQGLTLPWLAKRLNVPPPDPIADAVTRAALLHRASAAGLEWLRSAEDDDPHGTYGLVAARVEQRNFAAWERLGAQSEDETPSEAYVRIRQKMIHHERTEVLEIRDTGTVPSDIVSDVLGMLDVEESMLDSAARSTDEFREAAPDRAPTAACPELEAVADEAVPEPNSPGTCSECEREDLSWVHLRMCLLCGNIGCCDSSVGRHATGHYEQSGHPVMISGEPGESWRWCFVHELTG